MNTNKMDSIEVYKMFETLSDKFDKQADKQVESVEAVKVDATALDAVTERLKNIIEEIHKPTKVEYQHRHTVDIHSNWFFFSWVILVIIIFGLFWTLANQRQTISQYRENDLKYRYIKMQGQTDEESLYRLERQFQYRDSIKIVRKQVEKYEELVKEQVERIERTRRNSEEAEILQKDLNKLKNSKTN